jgi:hypothetical protein
MKFAIVLLILGFFVPAGDGKLATVKINRSITVSIPVNFVPMTESEARTKYFSSRMPIALYTSMDAKTDFSVNIMPTQWLEDDLPMLKNFYRSSFLNLYDTVNFIREEIQQINNRNFLVFEFVSIVRPDADAIKRQPSVVNYTYLQYTLLNGKMVMFTFTSPASQRENWQHLAEKMMHSVKIKKTL